MGKVIITGTPGSGKTSLLSMLSNIKVVSLGTEMLESTIGKMDRDRLRSELTNVQIKEIRRKALLEIDKIPGDIIIDTHTSIKSGNKYIAGFSEEDMPLLHDVMAIIYIDALASDILLRRAQDKTRKREVEAAEEIDEQKSVNISLATTFAQQLGVPLYIIINRQNRLEDASIKVEAAMKE